MLLQALRAEIEMKNLNLQETLLVQKSVGTRSHAKKRCGNAVPTPLHPSLAQTVQELWPIKTSPAQMMKVALKQR